MGMNKFFAILLICAALLFYSCSQCRTISKHFESSVVGLDRTVTLYANDGKVIRS